MNVPPWRRVVAHTAKKQPVTEHQVTVLQRLADCGASGSCAVGDWMDGGTLAALVQLGLAERMTPEHGERIGGCRYRASPEGSGQPLMRASAARKAGR
ncbi:hypothetical protein [Caulobacter sp. 3R27C2-B]|uniref:hypothetical protein n=1 Tax=Caulobacter sp. 3R27C2-B TaxID=2502219 RepID=UPI0010F6DE4C|nr:hypothetical protein [Caulobacter sp. 3R27C2-B]